MRNLTLRLHQKWFDMTKSGEKPEDYREINQYWFKRFVKDYKKVFKVYTGHNWDDDYLRDEGIDFIVRSKIKIFEFNPYYENIMTLGYPKAGDIDRILNYPHRGIEIRTGKREWGAEPRKLYFVIKHGPL